MKTLKSNEIAQIQGGVRVGPSLKEQLVEVAKQVIRQIL